MRILIISDIHANLAAFEAVLKASQGEWEQMWFLGDLLGYGPDPNACGKLLRAHQPVALTGNHDWAVLGKLSLNSFNFQARQVIEWTQETLDEATRATWKHKSQSARNRRSCSPTPARGSRSGSMCSTTGRLLPTLQQLAAETPVCLVGHTHVPILFTELDAGEMMASRPVYDEPVTLGGSRYIVNPGSVGQPRDGDPRAAYALLDTERMTWEHRRVAYRISETQQRMRRQGFPERLIARLEYGW
jgi:predicted phosphodiesterase